jgi:hypothetical protein
MSSEAETKKRRPEEAVEDAPEAKRPSNGSHADSGSHQLAPSWNSSKKYSREPFVDGELNYIECPAKFETKRGIVFLAGGISNCPDWQTIMKDLIHKNCPGLVPLNPRRMNFDVNAKDVHDEQIKWEFDALRASSVIIFWFPKETLCPITLYELGTWSILHKLHGSDIIVGTDPEYARAADVKTQLSLATDSDFPVVHSLADLAKSLQQWWDDHSE